MGSSCRYAAKHPWPHARSDTGWQLGLRTRPAREGGAGEPCGRRRTGGCGLQVSVRSGVRGGAAARGSKVHERSAWLQAGTRRRYRRRCGAEADSSGVPGGGGSDCNPEAARPCSPRPRAPGPGRGAPAAASPARAPGRCGAGPRARRPSWRVYTPDGGFSPIPFSTSSIRSSSITTAQGESASAARPRGAMERMGPASLCLAHLLLVAQ